MLRFAESGRSKVDIRRNKALGVSLCALALLGGCAAKEELGDQGTFMPPATIADTGVPPSSTPPPVTAMDSSAPSNPPAMTKDGGAPPAVVADTGAIAPVDAGLPAADAANGADGATGADGAAPTGPVTLPDPDKMGPYTVKEIDNVGMGFENPIESGDETGPSAGCAVFISLFTSNQMEIDSYSAVPMEYNMKLYTLYYPEGGAPGTRFPVLSWANGTCAHTVGYSDMIKHVVSHGFIVVATHSRFTLSGAAQVKGIDFVLAEDARQGSPLFGKVNKEQVGVFGHSQGGSSTGTAGADKRVKTSILMHGGNASRITTPVFFLTGEMDNPTGVRSNYDSARVPAAFGNLKMSNHITMMNGKGHMRMAPEVAAWFRYMLLNDEVAKKWFVGADCVLCKDSEWVYAQKNLK